MVKMLIFDLDKTLLNSETCISDRSISVLEKCRIRGIRICYATARSAQAASRMTAQFAPDVFIGYGGALTTAGGEVIYRSEISTEMSHKLINECLNSNEAITVLAVTENLALSSRMSAPSEKDSSHYKYFDFRSMPEHGFLKISLKADNPQTVERIAANYPELDMLRYTGEDLYRFANRNAAKWNAIKAAAEYYSESTKDYIAFGDDLIDVEMIKKCGTGVAMENAVDEVKAAADYVCGTNDGDGAAEWIEENVLHK